MTKIVVNVIINVDNSTFFQQNVFVVFEYVFIISHNCWKVNTKSYNCLNFVHLNKKDGDFMYKTNITVERIKSLAKQKGFKISDMLNSCELSKNALSSMQSRGSWLQANNLAKIADYLDCSVDYLLGRTDNPNSHKDL